ncbi:MAG: tRNA-modifying protein YgfZ [Candidatus Dasytiphilus stammeri]
MNYIEFPLNLPISSSELSLTLISMEDWCIIATTGQDSINYMQGQITADINQLHINNYYYSAHCNAQGKMLTNLLLFVYQGQLCWIIRRSVINVHITALKKYAIFSDINIIELDNTIMLGIAGSQVKSMLKKIFPILPNINYPVVENIINNIILIYFPLPRDRFILITDVSRGTLLHYQLYIQNNFLKFNNSKQWLALDIEAGYPIIDNDNSSKFFPQDANLHFLKAISWNKGCYIGQEVISRINYRGINKRGLYILIGYSLQLPSSNSIIEMQYNLNIWKICGKVLASCCMKNGQIWIQGIINNNLPLNTILRIPGNTEIIISKYFSFCKSSEL